jgi:ribosomal protein S27E
MAKTGQSEPRGRFRMDYWLSCGWCHNTSAVMHTPPQTPTKWAVAGGWKHTYLYGWVCPDCLNKQVTK